MHEQCKRAEEDRSVHLEWSSAVLSRAGKPQWLVSTLAEADEYTVLAFLRFFYTLERKRYSTLERTVCCFASQPLVSKDFVVLKIP